MHFSTNPGGGPVEVRWDAVLRPTSTGGSPGLGDRRRPEDCSLQPGVRWQQRCAGCHGTEGRVPAGCGVHPSRLRVSGQQKFNLIVDFTSKGGVLEVYAGAKP